MRHRRADHLLVSCHRRNNIFHLYRVNDIWTLCPLPELPFVCLECEFDRSVNHTLTSLNAATHLTGFLPPQFLHEASLFLFYGIS